MIQLIRINMLPYREQQDKQRKDQFIRLMILSALVGLGLLVFVYITLGGIQLNQESRNRQLTDGIAQLDAQIEEVKALEAEKRDFLNRKQKVEELETKRFEAARVIDSLNTVAPEGIYLTGIKAKTTETYTLAGKATSDNKIADFMRVIPTTNVFGQPTLDSINKVENVQGFELTVSVSSVPNPDAATANATVNSDVSAEQAQTESAASGVESGSAASGVESGSASMSSNAAAPTSSPAN